MCLLCRRTPLRPTTKSEKNRRARAGPTSTAGPARSANPALNPDAIPATIWLLDRVPRLDRSGHRVTIAGVAYSVDDLARGAQPIAARLDCTSGWYADAVWSGRPLSELIAPEALAGAGGLRVTSVTGYHRVFPAASAPDLWLAVACQGRPLTPGTGAPRAWRPVSSG